MPSAQLPAEGFVRLTTIIGRPETASRPAVPGLLPISRTTWYAAIKAGKVSEPTKFGRVSMWPVAEIRRLMTEGLC